MKTNLIMLRSFVLILTLQLITVNGLIAQTSASLAAATQSMDKYPDALLEHIDDWVRKQATAEQRPDTYIEIDQLAFYDNIQLVRTQILNDNTQLMVVIKSDAYGHGLEMLAGVAEMAGANYLGITENSSLITVKDMQLSSSIVRLRLASNDELIEAHSNRAKYGDVEEMIGNFEMAELLSRLGARQGRTIKIHLNLNTGGMSRNGFDLSVPAIKDQLLSLLKLQNIHVAGIMTHFPNADAEDITDTRTALANFMEAANWIIESGDLNRHDVLLHVANTSTTLRLPEAHLDMVRVGSLVFGEKLEKEAPDAMQQLMSVYSRIGQVVFYPKGSTVGYGSNTTLQRDSYLANIPIGKVNGLPPSLVEVLIGGRRYPTVGSMSMNTTMVDITDGWEGINSDDEVVIFGKQAQDEIRVEEHWRSTISDIHSFMGQLNHQARFAKAL